MMKRIILMVYGLWLFFSSPGGAMDTLISDVVAGMHTIPLLDGRSVFGDKVACVDDSYDLEHIDNDGKLGFHFHAQFLEYLINPVKEEGIFYTTYYTSKEILDVYKELAERARRLNPDAVAFFKDLLTHGNMYQHSLPHLYKQSERGALFQKVFDIRFDKPKNSMVKLRTIREELIAEEEGLAFAERSKPVPKQEDSTVRRRKVVADHLVGALGSGIDVSSENSPLLPKRIPAH